eukprot:s7463_g5.t1
MPRNRQEQNIQLTDNFTVKVVQLIDTIGVLHGRLLVGPTGGAHSCGPPDNRWVIFDGPSPTLKTRKAARRSNRQILHLKRNLHREQFLVVVQDRVHGQSSCFESVQPRKVLGREADEGTMPRSWFVSAL